MPSGAPPPSANPSEVRAYLVQVLTNYHSFTEDYSQKLADCWPCGRGWDLYRLEAADYQKLWGKEIGFYLYESVQEDIRADWRQSPEGIACIYMWAISVSLGSTFAIHGFCLAPALELGDERVLL
ncbi:hypothetical protein MW887_011551 [Aspergillus wentii]|nr:hypothetical protein MW887_011551 [Aspergillus wentii]